jgi:hypothetical protein
MKMEMEKLLKLLVLQNIGQKTHVLYDTTEYYFYAADFICIYMKSSLNICDLKTKMSFTYLNISVANNRENSGGNANSNRPIGI